MTRIAIIGAGCAGLGAATALLAYDVEVLMIEASDRIGGRAWTSEDPPGLPIDMGPQFVQDPADNPWKPIMDRLVILGVAPEIDAMCRVLGADGGWTDEEWPIRAMWETNAAIENGYAAASTKANAPPIAAQAELPEADAQAQALALGSNGYGAIAESAEPWHYIASDAERQITASQQNNIYVQGGIGNLVRAYARDLLQRHPRQLTIVTQARVTAIASRAQGVSLAVEDGRSSETDFAIVTVPVSQLGPDGLTFDPPLDETRRTALGLVALGAYKKVAFRPVALPAAIEVGKEYYIYDAVSAGCWQYFRLPTDPTILICVASGDFARQLDGAQPALVFAAIETLLSASYPGATFAALDGKMVVTNWTNQPFVQGAYSYTRYDPARDSDDPTAFQARAEIAKPHHRIHFAGEATWMQGYGTIAGAYRSGERAAAEIVARIGIALR